MAPQPIEEIDFPDLGDKIRELLLAIWTYICDIFIVLWFYISHAFWVVWTWPPFETFRNDFSAAMITLWDYGPSSAPLTNALYNTFSLSCYRGRFSRRTSRHSHGNRSSRVHRLLDGLRLVQTMPFALSWVQEARRAPW